MAERAKENPPSAVKSVAKAARTTPGAISTNRALTPRSDNNAMPGAASTGRTGVKTPATGRSAMSRAGGTPFAPKSLHADDDVDTEDDDTGMEYATAGETPTTAYTSAAKSKTPGVEAVDVTPAEHGNDSRRERLPMDAWGSAAAAASTAKESTPSKGSMVRTARKSAGKKATPEPIAMDVDSPAAAEPEAEPEAAPASAAIALISPVSSPRVSPRLAAAASARERIEEAVDAMDTSVDSPSPTRQSPRLTAARAAHSAMKATSHSAMKGVTPGRGPVAGAAASKTPSRFAPTPAPEPTVEEPVEEQVVEPVEEQVVEPEAIVEMVVEPATEPEPAAKPRRRKGLTGGGAVRVLVSEQRVQIKAIEAEAETLTQTEAVGERRTMSPARPTRSAAPVKAPEAVAPPKEVVAVPKAVASAVPPAVAARTTRAMAARAAAVAGAKRERERPAPLRTAASRSSAGAGGKYGAVPKLTVPKSPNLSRPPKRQRLDSQKTSEDLAFEKSQRDALEEKQRMRVTARRAAARGAGHRAPKPSTKPVTPSFSRTHGMATRAVVAHGDENEHSPFRSVAQTFKKETAKKESYHDKPPTVARSPALSRPSYTRTKAKTTEELELEAIAAAPKFRARPLRRAVLKGAGDASERAKAAADQKRGAARRAKEGEAKKGGWDKQLGRKRGAEAAADAEERATREAKRRKELETYGQGGFMPPTAPESPKLSTNRRAMLKAPAAAAGVQGGIGRGASRVTMASDVPATSVDWSARPLTQPLGFNLTTDRRGAYAAKVLERRKVEEEEAAVAARRVRAKPVPVTTRRRSSQCFVPNEIKVTRFEPFNLKGEALHEYERKREAQRREEEAAAAKAAAEFKARPLPFSTFNPMFEVNPSDAAPTVPIDLKLPGDSRAENRARFEEANARRLAEQARQRAEAERLKAADEERERRRLRRSLVFKAQPVPDYDELATVGVAPVPEAELTVPESPFATRRTHTVYRYN